MNRILPIFLLLAASIAPASLFAEVSVSYQVFQPNEVVFEFGKHTISAKEFTKYGIEPIKVTVVNVGESEEIMTFDKPCMSADQIYARLKYSYFAMTAKILVLACFVFNMGAQLGFYICDPMNYKDLWADRPDAHDLREMFAYFKKGLYTLVEANEKFSITLFCSTIGITGAVLAGCFNVYSRYNHAVYAACESTSMSKDCVVLPGQTITKVMFVAKA